MAMDPKDWACIAVTPRSSTLLQARSGRQDVPDAASQDNSLGEHGQRAAPRRRREMVGKIPLPRHRAETLGREAVSGPRESLENGGHPWLAAIPSRLWNAAGKCLEHGHEGIASRRSPRFTWAGFCGEGHTYRRAIASSEEPRTLLVLCRSGKSGSAAWRPWQSPVRRRRRAVAPSSDAASLQSTTET